MKRTLKSEFLKLRYQRSTWWLLVSSLAFATLQTTSTVVSTANLGGQIGLPGLDTVDGVRNVYANAMSSYIIALIVGIIISTGEFRHSTAVATYLAQPHRNIVMATKMMVAAVAGIILQLLSAIVSIAAAAALLTRYDAATLPTSEFVRITGVALLSGLVMAIMGVAIGQLIRNQIVAITASLFWLLIVEGLIIAFAEQIGKWLPTGAISGMLSLSVESDVFSFGKDLLSPWPATALLVAYALAFATIAAATTLRRDID